MERRDVKITVLKQIENPEIIQKYNAEGSPTACPLLKVGQEFTSKAMFMPEGFCPWAWPDIQRDVVVLSLGGKFPWIKQEGTMISCCTDGLKALVFKLERI